MSTAKGFAVLAGAANRYRMSIEGCLESAIGGYGLDAGLLGRRLDALAPHLAALRDDARTGRLELFTQLGRSDDIAAAASALASLSRDAHTLVFFGTGGSSLGGQTLAQLAGWNIPGTATPEQRKRPRTRFYDNLDGATLQQALDSLDLARTRFVVTSKSGNTPETLVQALAALGAVKEAGLEPRIPELFLGITEPAAAGRTNGLRALLGAHGVPMLDHPTGIGGRYSVLSIVGLLPAMARGLDPHALRAGALAVVEEMLAADDPRELAAAVGAAAAAALAESRGIGVQIMMPYADRLQRLGAWFVQLWAESLGKNGQGTTPIACLGPLDQHSQLQLFMDGPRAHTITLLRCDTGGAGPRIDPQLAMLAGIEVMAGRTVGELVAAQGVGIADALATAGRPVRTFDIPRLDEAAMGGLLMHFMLETILAGRLMGIDPFDQPAVELAKSLSRRRLERPV